jgi:hypothetical protein
MGHGSGGGRLPGEVLAGILVLIPIEFLMLSFYQG